MVWEKELFKLYDEKDIIDVEQVFQLLHKTYWASTRDRETLQKLIDNSTCFSLFRGDEQVGFVRVVSDFARTSWVSDMIIKKEYQGKGLGEWMMHIVMTHPLLNQTQFSLQTKDAHSFYEKLGFKQRETLMSTEVSYL